MLQQTSIEMVLFLSYFVLCAQRMVCLQEGQPNVCGNSRTGEVYCCFNYEYDESGNCTECKIGYSSRNGNPCAVCSLGSYGYRCAWKCVCTFNERCDHQEGCVNISNIETSTKRNFINATDGDINSSLLSFTTDASLHDLDQTSKTAYQIDEFPIRQIPLISLTSGIIVVCLVVYIIVSNSICFLMYKKIKKNQHDQGIITPQPVALYDEIGTVHYQEVSLPPIINHEHEFTFQLQPTTKSESETISENQSNDGNDQGSDFENRQTNLTVSEDDGQQEETVNNSEQNEHSYIPLLPPRENRHPYEKCPLVNDNIEESQHSITTSYAHYMDMGI